MRLYTAKKRCLFLSPLVQNRRVYFHVIRNGDDKNVQLILEI